MCTHNPPCPPAQAPDHAFARVIARQDDIGWSLLCNKVIVFDDTGEVLPDGTVVEPEGRPPLPGRAPWARSGWGVQALPLAS